MANTGRHTALQQMWEELDRLTDTLRGPEGNENAIGLSNQALGVARCLAMFYADDLGLDWVRRQAMARWSARRKK